MMRRPTGIAQGASHDSFLDIMTNVAGFLLIVVVVTQLGVGSAVRRAASAAPTAEAVERARAEREALESALGRVRERWGAIEGSVEPDRAGLARAEEARRRLEEELLLRERSGLPARPLREELAVLEAEGARSEERLEELEREHPEAAPAPASPADDEDAREEKILRLPDPRPPEGNRQPVALVCRRGKVVPFQADAISKKISEELEALAPISDPSEVVRLFERKDIGDDCFRIRIIDRSLRLGTLTVPRMLIRFEFRPEAPGIAIGELRKGLPGLLAGRDPGKHYLRFLAWDDSFEVYRKARRIAEGLGYRAGWLPFRTGSAGDPGEEIEILIPPPPGDSDDGLLPID